MKFYDGKHSDIIQFLKCSTSHDFRLLMACDSYVFIKLSRDRTINRDAFLYVKLPHNNILWLHS